MLIDPNTGKTVHSAHLSHLKHFFQPKDRIPSMILSPSHFLTVEVSSNPGDTS